jgi:hypothetical protein
LRLKIHERSSVGRLNDPVPGLDWPNLTRLHQSLKLLCHLNILPERSILSKFDSNPLSTPATGRDTLTCIGLGVDLRMPAALLKRRHWAFVPVGGNGLGLFQFSQGNSSCEYPCPRDHARAETHGITPTKMRRTTYIHAVLGTDNYTVSPNISVKKKAEQSHEPHLSPNGFLPVAIGPGGCCGLRAHGIDGYRAALQRQG